MRVLAIDPSSSAIGVALCEGKGMGINVMDAWRIYDSGSDPWERIESMCAELRDVIINDLLDDVPAVIEMPATKVHRRTAGAQGLATYGVAVGRAWAAIIPLIDEVHLVRAGAWSRIPKRKRQQWVIETVPGYDAKSDPGADVADAIELASVWINHQVITGALL